MVRVGISYIMTEVGRSFQVRQISRDTNSNKVHECDRQTTDHATEV